MNILSFNTEVTSNTFSDRDVLSVFKQQPERAMTIQQGMSAKEISDVVSEKIIAVVKEQFEATKAEFHLKQKK